MNVDSYRLGKSYLNYLFSPSNSVYNFGKNSFSVEAWVKSFTGGPLLARKAKDGGSNHGGFILSIGPATITFTNDDGSYYNSIKATGVTVCDGKWHHIAAIRLQSTGYIYLDGNAVSTALSGNKAGALNVNSIDRLTIGKLDQSDTSFTGYLTEIRLWNVARTAGEVFQNFRRRLTPAEIDSKLVGYWTGEFGTTVDFSLSRNQTSSVGLKYGSSKCPPISHSSYLHLFYVFRGIYDCSTKAKDSSSWKESPQIIVTSQGFVVSGGSTVINGVQLDGACLSWPSSGNSYGASVELLPCSRNTAYWSSQLNRPVFEGTTTETVQGKTVLYRGSIVFARTGSGVLLNVGTSKFVQCIAPAVGSPVTFCNASEDTETVQTRDRFCQYDTGGIIHADSYLALKPATSTVAGSKVLLTTPTLGGVHQSWSVETNGRIVLKATPSLVLSASDPDSSGVQSVIIDKANPKDLKQKWLSLGNSQHICNGLNSNAVLVGVGQKAVAIRAKADGQPAQSWYISGSSLICASSALALTTTGYGAGDALQLRSWSPDDPKQQFTYSNRKITHVATGMILVSKGDLTNGTVSLADPETIGPNSEWSITLGSVSTTASSRTSSTTRSTTSSTTSSITSSTISSNVQTPALNETKTTRKAQTLTRTSRQVAEPLNLNGVSVLGDFTCGLTSAGLTSYIVTITTSNLVLAGTDDIIKISLENRFTKTSLPLLELNNSLTHPKDSFEKGSKDVFVLSNLQDIGQVTDVTIEMSRPHWYSFKDSWLVTGLSVSNAKWHTNSLWIVQQMEGLAGLDMPDKVSLPMLIAPGGKYNCTMTLGMAPAQDRIGKKFGWDHTWIEVLDKTEDSKTTYFDCAGGHGGTGTKREVLGICDRNAVVRMSTGYNIDDSHPLKDAYGTNRLDGFENANLRCDGKLKWDGQCHQIA